MSTFGRVTGLLKWSRDLSRWVFASSSRRTGSTQKRPALFGAPAFFQLFREACRGQVREYPKRILVIDLLQHFIRQIKRVQFPEPVILPNVIDPLVVGFEHTEIERILADGVRIFPEENPILIFDEEPSGRAG